MTKKNLARQNLDGCKGRSKARCHGDRQKCHDNKYADEKHDHNRPHAACRGIPIFFNGFGTLASFLILDELQKSCSMQVQASVPEGTGVNALALRQE